MNNTDAVDAIAKELRIDLWLFSRVVVYYTTSLAYDKDDGWYENNMPYSPLRQSDELGDLFDIYPVDAFGAALWYNRIRMIKCTLPESVGGGVYYVATDGLHTIVIVTSQDSIDLVGEDEWQRIALYRKLPNLFRGIQ